MNKILIYISLCMLISNCSTAPDTLGEATDVGVWQGKVLMINKKTNHKKWANVTWASDSSRGKMRVDVRAILDVPIATLIKSEEESHLWLFTENKYFHSLDGAKLFRYLTKLSLDPDIFYSLLGEPKAPVGDWQCKDNKNTYTCFSQSNKTRFSVEHHKRDHRVIKIDRGSKALRIRLSRSKVEVRDALFKPLSTSHFKTIKI